MEPRPDCSTAPQYRFIPILTYLFNHNSEARVLRFAVHELAQPTVQEILRVMTALYGTPVINRAEQKRTEINTKERHMDTPPIVIVRIIDLRDPERAHIVAGLQRSRRALKSWETRRRREEERRKADTRAKLRIVI